MSIEPSHAHDTSLEEPRPRDRRDGGLRVTRAEDPAWTVAAKKPEVRARSSKGGEVSAREVAELRDLVEQREREVRRLRDANHVRERLMQDMRAKLDLVAGDRQTAEARLAGKERVWSTLESRVDVMHDEVKHLRAELKESRVANEHLRTDAAAARDALADAQGRVRTLEATQDAMREGAERGWALRERELIAEGAATIEQWQAAYRAHVAQLQDAIADKERGLEAATGNLRDELAAVRSERDALEACVKDQASRVASAEAGCTAARTQSDWLAKNLSDAMARLAEVRKGAESESRRVQDELAALIGLVQQFTWSMVAQTAEMLALKDGRKKPIVFDVDEAMTRVAARMPAALAEDLWASREKICEAMDLDLGPSVTMVAGSPDASFG